MQRIKEGYNVLLLTIPVSLYILLREIVYQSTGAKKSGSIKQYILDLTVLAVPILLNFTVTSDYHIIINLILLVLIVLYLGIKFRWRDKSLYPLWSSDYPFSKNKSFVSTFRSYVTLCTIVAILACDFLSIFPREFSKTMYSGYSLMDTGVGSFVFMAGLVAPEARDPTILGHKKKLLKKSLVACTILVILGLIRVSSMAALGYVQSEFEYGRDWNFFFTLASVRLASSLILCIPLCGIYLVQYSWCVSVIIAVIYQLLLGHHLTEYLRKFKSDDNVNFIDANRFGIYSSVGMVSIYFAGCTYGYQIFKKRESLWGQFKLLLFICILAPLLWLLTYFISSKIELPSRCFGNITYIVWSVAHNSSVLAGCFVVEFLSVIINKQLEDPWIPGGCQSCYYKDKNRLKCCCLVTAISNNQLLFFIIGNLLTGLVNALLDAHTTDPSISLLTLTLYITATTGVVCVMFANKWTIKFW